MEAFLQTSIQQIQAAAVSGRLVVFIGAGVSLNSGLPSWLSLIHDMAQQLGRANDNRRYSSDDFLKIPQLYYNQRSATEYFRRIESQFNPNAEPNAIHRLILELDPAHIITTNYDSLIEQEAARSDKPYHIVKCDTDLPFARYPRLIIKMHGDLGLRNIVLKEDDYLSYKKNFQFIETVVKSLFATNLILFIGFSATDSNFKIIYQWVKDALNGEAQPAYLLQLNGSFDIDEFQYFKAKGINIVYWSALEKAIKSWQSEPNDTLYNKLSNTGKDLYLLLRYIKEFREPTDPITWAHNTLSSLEPLQALLPKQIEDILNKDIRKFALNHDLLYTVDKDTTEYLSKHLTYTGIKSLANHDELTALRSIRDILSKSNINAFKYNKRLGTSIHSQPELSESDETYRALMEFDFNRIEASIDQSTHFSEDAELTNILKHAYSLMLIGRVIESHNALERASSISLHRKEDWPLILSYYNRRHIARISWVNAFSQYGLSNRDAVHSIRQERDTSLDSQFGRRLQAKPALYHILRSMEDSIFLRETFDQLKEVTGDHRKIAKSLKDSRDIFIDPDPFYVGEFLLSSFESFVFRNSIMVRYNGYAVDVYREYCYGRFIRYSAESKFQRQGDMARIWGPEILQIDYRTLALSIQYISPIVLEEMLNELNIFTISTDDNSTQMLVRGIDNLLSFATNKNLRGRLFFFEPYFTGFLSILRRIDLTPESTSHIIEVIAKYFNTPHLISTNCSSYIDRFLSSKGSRFLESDAETTENILNKVILHALKRNSNILNKDTREVIATIVDIIPKLAGNNCTLPLSGEASQAVSATMEGWANMASTLTNDIIHNAFIPLYPILPPPIRNQLSSFIKLALSGTWHGDSWSIAYAAIQHGIIAPDDTVLDCYIEGAFSKMVSIQSQESPKQYEYHSLDVTLKDLAILLANGWIRKNKKRSLLVQLSRHSAFLSFVLSPSNFDYSNFSVEWLGLIPEKLVRRLSKDRAIRHGVVSQVRAELKANSSSHRAIDLLFTFFVETEAEAH